MFKRRRIYIYYQCLEAFLGIGNGKGLSGCFIETETSRKDVLRYDHSNQMANRYGLIVNWTAIKFMYHSFVGPISLIRAFSRPPCHCAFVRSHKPPTAIVFFFYSPCSNRSGIISRALEVVVGRGALEIFEPMYIYVCIKSGPSILSGVSQGIKTGKGVSEFS